MKGALIYLILFYILLKHNSHSIEDYKQISPYCIHIFVMYVGCAPKNIVALPIILNSMWAQK